MADAECVGQFAAQVLEHHGRLDVLINNAAIGGPSAPMWEVEVDDWKETLNINTTGPFLTSRAFLPSMVGKKSGSIVFVGSMTGKRELLNRTAYAASKIAIVGLARSLAWEVGPYGIRVNVVSPGPMEGERMKWVLEKQAENENITVDAARARLTSSSPLGRFVSTQDVVSAILFLASDDAGSTTGEDLNVSSGICMY
jgi:NAD(P)-dependent dehydrogenase (short-subunit alcohol dehydrogenase family)